MSAHIPCTTEVAVNVDLVRKYSVPGPRYTSYPTAPHFSDCVSHAAILSLIQESNEKGRPLSLYFHLPFCYSLCWYCGCNTVITRDENKAATYVDYLLREIDVMGRYIDMDRRVVQMHFGGGTPTFLSPEVIRHLCSGIRDRFNFEAGAEISVEVDPRRFTPEHALALSEGGFNRASVGIQDFSPEVQKAVNRTQTVEETRQSIDWLRRAGMKSINVDLIYGLPKQNRSSFSASIDQVLEMSPERLAVFNYAHVPWMKPAQKLLNELDFPHPDERIRMLKDIIERLTSEGYVYIGMDHFARPDDELSVAQSHNCLQRNFQGYSTHGGADIMAFGLSSISQIESAYFQNAKKLETFYASIDAGKLPLEKACIVSRDDIIRREIIMHLMCNLELDFHSAGRRLGIDFATYFSRELNNLSDLEADGLLVLTPSRLRLTQQGRLFLRNIAMRFDAYLVQPERSHRYSSTV